MVKIAKSIDIATLGVYIQIMKNINEMTQAELDAYLAEMDVQADAYFAAEADRDIAENPWMLTGGARSASRPRRSVPSNWTGD